jgi:O-antigen/teichoic acid export membrane protein
MISMEHIFKKHSNLIFYLVFGYLGKIIPGALLLSLGYIMTPEEFGRSAIFISIVTILAAVYGAGINIQAVREYGRLESKDYSSLISSSLFLAMAFSFISIPILWLVNDGLTSFLIIALTILSGFSLYVGGVYQKVLMMRKKAKEFGYLDTFRQVAVAGMTFALVFFIVPQWEMRVYAVACTSILIAIYICINSELFILSNISFKYIRYCFKGFYSAMPMILSNSIKQGADKLLVASLLLPADLGIYAYVMLIGSFFSVFNMAVNNYVTPNLMKTIQEGKSCNGLMFKSISILIAGYFISIFLLVNLVDYFPAEYSIGPYSLIITAVAMLSQAIYLLFMKKFLVANKVSLLGYIGMACSFFYVASLYMQKSIGVEEALCLYLYYSLLQMVVVVVVGRKISIVKE